MSHNMLRPFIIKVSVLVYFPLVGIPNIYVNIVDIFVTLYFICKYIIYVYIYIYIYIYVCVCVHCTLCIVIYAFYYHNITTLTLIIHTI